MWLQGIVSHLLALSSVHDTRAPTWQRSVRMAKVWQPRMLSTTPALPAAATDCWRPTIDDVDRISWGRNAKQKGTGSRGVPHRLNDEERTLYDMARSKGFVEIGGSGWRRQRSASPLTNTYRSWSDARGVPAIYVHKSRDGSTDEVVVDLSTLRTPSTFEAAAAFCLSEAPDGDIEFEDVSNLDGVDEMAVDASQSTDESPNTHSKDVGFRLGQLEDVYLTEPIYRLPMYAVSWVRTRSEAKSLAKRMADLLGTADQQKGRRKAKGAPTIKPGKSRRHGGYGIG